MGARASGALRVLTIEAAASVVLALTVALWGLWGTLAYVGAIVAILIIDGIRQARAGSAPPVPAWTSALGPDIPASGSER